MGRVKRYLVEIIKKMKNFLFGISIAFLFGWSVSAGSDHMMEKSVFVNTLTTQNLNQLTYTIIDLENTVQDENDLENPDGTWTVKREGVYQIECKCHITSTGQRNSLTSQIFINDLPKSIPSTTYIRNTNGHNVDDLINTYTAPLSAGDKIDARTKRTGTNSTASFISQPIGCAVTVLRLW